MRAKLKDRNEFLPAKEARWIYEHLDQNAEDFERSAQVALVRMGWDEKASWVRDYLWRGLEEHRGADLGESFVAALMQRFTNDAADAERFCDLYSGPATSYRTRRAALFGLSEAIFLAACWPSRERGSRPLPEETWKKIYLTCDAALRDESAYMREAAYWVANKLVGYEEEMRILEATGFLDPPNQNQGAE